MATENKGIKHTQGGWPKEYDYSDPADVNKYKKRLERERDTNNYSTGVTKTVKDSEQCIQQNN